MKIIILCLSFIIFLTFISFNAYALNMEAELAEIAGVKYTKECLTECHLPLKIRFDATLSLSNIDFKYSKELISGNDNIKEIEIKYLTIETGYHNEPIIECQEKITENMTRYKECDVTGYNKIPYQKFVWVDMPPIFDAMADNYFYIDIVGYRTGDLLNNSYIDIVPEIRGIKLNQFAWWNSSWKKAFNITINNTDTNAHSYEIINVTFNTSGFKQDDCDDVRVVNNTGSEIGRWIQNCSSENVTLYFEVDYIGDSTAINYTVYFNNSNAETPENYSAYFDFFDQASLDSQYLCNKTGTGTCNIVDSNLRLNQTASSTYVVYALLNETNHFYDTFSWYANSSHDQSANRGMYEIYEINKTYNATELDGWCSIVDGAWACSRSGFGMKDDNGNDDELRFWYQDEQYYNPYIPCKSTSVRSLGLSREGSGYNTYGVIRDSSTQFDVYSNDTTYDDSISWTPIPEPYGYTLIFKQYGWDSNVVDMNVSHYCLISEDHLCNIYEGNFPTITINLEEEYEEEEPPLPPSLINANVIVCFALKPVCVNLADNSIYYKVGTIL